MRIQTSNTNATLWGLMSEAQKEAALSSRGDEPIYTLTLQNNDGSIIQYFEVGATATATDSMPIAVNGGKTVILVNNLRDVNIIAASGTPYLHFSLHKCL